jgi:hypothetical protein
LKWHIEVAKISAAGNQRKLAVNQGL